MIAIVMNLDSNESSHMHVSLQFMTKPLSENSLSIVIVRKFIKQTQQINPNPRGIVLEASKSPVT